MLSDTRDHQGGSSSSAAAAVGFVRPRYICYSLTDRWTKKKPKLTHKHTADLREAALPLQTSTGRTLVKRDWPGRWYDWRVGPAVVCQTQSTNQRKQKTLCSGGAGRSHPEHVIQRQCDVISQSASSSRPAYMRVDANSTQDLALSLLSSSAFVVPSLIEETSTGSLSTCWGNLRLQLVVEAQSLVSQFNRVFVPGETFSC